MHYLCKSCCVTRSAFEGNPNPNSDPIPNCNLHPNPNLNSNPHLNPNPNPNCNHNAYPNPNPNPKTNLILALTNQRLTPTEFGPAVLDAVAMREK